MGAIVVADTVIGLATANVHPGCPLGPLTAMFWPSMFTSTPDGTGTGVYQYATC